MHLLLFLPPPPQIPSWLANDLEDARHNPTSPLSPASPLSPTSSLSPASPLSPGPIPLGLPVIVGQGPLSNGPPAAILMRPTQPCPQTPQQPLLRSPRHRSVSSETVLVPHPQQPKDPFALTPSGQCAPGVQRYPSENALTPKRDVGVRIQFERPQRQEAKGTPHFGSSNLPATPSYRGSGGGASGHPQGIGRGEPAATGQLKLPAIVNSSHQADPVLLGNQRSQSGSQIMSPTFIKKLHSGTRGWSGVGGVGVWGVVRWVRSELFLSVSVVAREPKKGAAGAHRLFPRQQSVPQNSIVGRLPRQSVSDSAATDDDVATATPSHAWDPVSLSSGVPAHTICLWMG